MGQGEPGKQNVDANNATEMSHQPTLTTDNSPPSQHQNEMESEFANKICTNSEANANNATEMSHQPSSIDGHIDDICTYRHFLI